MPFRLIGLTGPARSGKDTIAHVLRTEHDVLCTSFAAPIRQFVASLCGVTVNELENIKDEVFPTFDKTPRMMMQTLGTEWGRDIVDPLIWVKIVKTKIQRAIERDRPIAITDIRFDNEAELIRDMGGEFWHISREIADIPDGSHRSEQGVTKLTNDILITNNATQEDLIDRVYAHMKN